MGKWSEQKKNERGFFFIFVPTFPSAASFEKEGGGEKGKETSLSASLADLCSEVSARGA